MADRVRAISVTDLLADPMLSSAATLGGSAGLGNRVTDVGWYSGGELDDVAGHLIICESDHVQPIYRMDALIRRAADAGVAALMIAAPEQRPLLSTIRLADRLELPLLSIGTVHLVDMLHHLTIRIRAPELIRARLIEDVVRRLRTRSTGKAIVDALGKALDLPVSVLSPQGLGIVGDEVALPTELRLDLAVPQLGQHSEGDGVFVAPLVEPGATKVIAWLACPLREGQISRREEVAAAFGVADPFVRSWLLRRRVAADLDTNLRANLLAEIVAGRDAVSHRVVEGAVSLGWSLADWHIAIHVLCEGSGDVDREATRVQLESALAQQHVQVTRPVDRGDGWATWITSPVEPAQGEGRRVLRAVRSTLVSLPAEWRMVAGIGRPHRGTAGLAESLAEARDAASLARAHQHRPAVEHVDEVGVTRLLAVWQRSDVLQAFAESALAPLKGADQHDLLVTLRTYLESGGSVSDTARALGLHRNTVALRLGRLRERLGADLDDPSQRLALQMACRTVDVRDQRR